MTNHTLIHKGRRSANADMLGEFHDYLSTDDDRDFEWMMRLRDEFAATHRLQISVVSS